MKNKEFEKFLNSAIGAMWKQGSSKTAFILMCWLLFAWHDMEYAESFQTTDKNILAATNIKRRSALRKAKKELEQAGLISYTPSNAFGGTTYRIMDMKG